eukprot:1035905-Lingulodinium_polyedra.AAC.1
MPFWRIDWTVATNSPHASIDRACLSTGRCRLNNGQRCPARTPAQVLGWHAPRAHKDRAWPGDPARGPI